MTTAHVQGVQVVHWNPRRNRLPRPMRRLPIGPRVQNFGDLIGPALIERIVESLQIKHARSSGSKAKRRLVGVGSILHLARTNDVVWGSGFNAKVASEAHDFRDLDVRAVRGPLTRAWLERRSIEVPSIYGDPALLLPAYFPELVEWATQKSSEIVVVPNLHDFSAYAGHPNVVNPQATLDVVLGSVLRAEGVVASSLHGIVVAEAFGIPAALIASRTEPSFKYDDYVEGTGRLGMPRAQSLDEAIRLLESRDLKEAKPLANWSSESLMDAFPSDMWVT